MRSDGTQRNAMGRVNVAGDSDINLAAGQLSTKQARMLCLQACAASRYRYEAIPICTDVPSRWYRQMLSTLSTRRRPQSRPGGSQVAPAICSLRANPSIPGLCMVGVHAYARHAGGGDHRL